MSLVGKWALSNERSRMMMVFWCGMRTSYFFYICGSMTPFQWRNGFSFTAISDRPAENAKQDQTAHKARSDCTQSKIRLHQSKIRLHTKQHQTAHKTRSDCTQNKIRLKELGIPTLEYRQVRSDLIQVYKILNGIDAVEKKNYFLSTI